VGVAGVGEKKVAGRGKIAGTGGSQRAKRAVGRKKKEGGAGGPQAHKSIACVRSIPVLPL
jgi:hypothetical protein